jgi:hypothetical protein
VLLLGSRLGPAVPPPADKLGQMLADLDSDRYERREAAFNQLANFGELVELIHHLPFRTRAEREEMAMIGRILVSVAIIGGLMIGMLQLDLEHAPTCCMELRSEHERAQALDVLGRQVRNSIEAKKQIACDVAAGRMTLRQAVVQFAEVARGYPYDWDHHALDHPEWSPSVRCAQYVIYDVETVLYGKVQDSAEIVARLEAEKNAW